MKLPFNISKWQYRKRVTYRHIGDAQLNIPFRIQHDVAINCFLQYGVRVKRQILIHNSQNEIFSSVCRWLIEFSAGKNDV